MPISPSERSEAQALKDVFNKILPKMQSRGDVHLLLTRIERDTGKPVRLQASYVFQKDDKSGLAPHHHAFESYNAELEIAITTYGWFTEYSHWKMRLSDFKQVRPDFRIAAVMIVAPAKLLPSATSSVPLGPPTKPYDLNHNDRRFLKSLRVLVDDKGQPA